MKTINPRNKLPCPFICPLRFVWSDVNDRRGYCRAKGRPFTIESSHIVAKTSRTQAHPKSQITNSIHTVLQVQTTVLALVQLALYQVFIFIQAPRQPHALIIANNIANDSLCPLLILWRCLSLFPSSLYPCRFVSVWRVFVCCFSFSACDHELDFDVCLCEKSSNQSTCLRGCGSIVSLFLLYFPSVLPSLPAYLCCAKLCPILSRSWHYCY